MFLLMMLLGSCDVLSEGRNEGVFPQFFGSVEVWEVDI